MAGSDRRGGFSCPILEKRPHYYWGRDNRNCRISFIRFFDIYSRRTEKDGFLSFNGGPEEFFVATMSPHKSIEEMKISSLKAWLVYNQAIFFGRVDKKLKISKI